MDRVAYLSLFQHGQVLLYLRQLDLHNVFVSTAPLVDEPYQIQLRG